MRLRSVSKGLFGLYGAISATIGEKRRYEPFERHRRVNELGVGERLNAGHVDLP